IGNYPKSGGGDSRHNQAGWEEFSSCASADEDSGLCRNGSSTKSSPGAEPKRPGGESKRCPHPDESLGRVFRPCDEEGGRLWHHEYDGSVRRQSLIRRGSYSLRRAG